MTAKLKDKQKKRNMKDWEAVRWINKLGTFTNSNSQRHLKMRKDDKEKAKGREEG